MNNNNTTLEFKIVNQFLKRIESKKIISKSKKIVKCKFHFDTNEWVGLNKFAIFKDSWGHSQTIHLGKESTLVCNVPSNVLKGTYFKVSVYAADLITTNNVTVPMMKSGYNHNHQHEHHHHCENSSKDIYVEIFDKLDTKIDDISFADDCLHIFSEGKLIDSICLPYVDEAHFRLYQSGLIQELEKYVQLDELEPVLKELGYVNHVYLDDDGFLIFE